MIQIRTERKDRGWSRLTMAKKLRAAADNPNEVPGLESLLHNIDRWERGGGISERYRILYCRALNRTELELFGIQPPRINGSLPTAGIPAAAPPLDGYDGLVMVRLPRGAQRISVDVFIADENQAATGNAEPMHRLTAVKSTGIQDSPS